MTSRAHTAQASSRRRPAAYSLAEWAASLEPSSDDLQLAERALADTVAVALGARDEKLLLIARPLGAGGRLAVAAHVLDYDDLHVPSTSHISSVCVPAALTAGGGARAYLAGAGTMARLGAQLGFTHYEAGWHTTCTAGAPAAAVAAGVAMGLNVEQLVTAIALALPAAGGSHHAFGSDAKALQVGFAVDAGLRAAALAAVGATADPNTLDRWLALVGGTDAQPVIEGPAVPGGLAIKLFPCCYALQRPIQAVAQTLAGEPPQHDAIEEITVTAPASALRPLIHHHPRTGLQGKFSLEYAVAASVIDGPPGFDSFTDEAVLRRRARDLMQRVHIHEQPGGDGLLSGTVHVELRLRTGGSRASAVTLPQGAPGRPATEAELLAKHTDCAGASAAAAIAALSWERAADEVPELIRATGSR